MMMQARVGGELGAGAIDALSGGVGGQERRSPANGAPDARAEEEGDERVAFLVFRVDGTIELGSREGRTWLAERAAVQDAVLEGLAALEKSGRGRYQLRAASVEVRLTRLEGVSGVRYMAALRDLGGEMSCAMLTPTQREVASYAVAGATVAEIARHLGRSPETVRSHLREIYRRLDVSNRIELARALQRWGW